MPKWLDRFQDPDEPVPATRTSYECRLVQGTEATQCALEGIAVITRVIARLSPNDTETYALMLDVRKEYQENAKRYIRRVFGA